MGFKYIMIEAGIYSYPIIFPDKLVHANVAEAIIPLIPKYTGISSAGELNLLVNEIYGRSSTLDLQADNIDAQVINTYSYMNGIGVKIDVGNKEKIARMIELGKTNLKIIKGE